MDEKVTAEKTLYEIQQYLNKIKKVFSKLDYDDNRDGWIVEDYLNAIQDALNEYANRDLKASEPDPFN